MRIGITFDLKDEAPLPLPSPRCGERVGGGVEPGLPDDMQEEFDSPVTIQAISAALTEAGHQVIALGDGPEMLRRLLADPPDFVFNVAEGRGVSRSREARVPAVLEMLGIPYTGSDPLTLAVTLDKDCAKRLVASTGIAVPKGKVIHPDEAASAALEHDLPYPVIVKPAWEGSSKGIRGRCVVERPDELPNLVANLQKNYSQPILIEEFIQGDELTVGILGNSPPQVLGIMRVLPLKPTERFVYSLEVKRDYERQVRYDCPASLTPADTRAVEKAALDSFRALGCRDVARVDFRLRQGVPYFLEVNPLPGINPDTSDLIIMARQCGWNYAQLIGMILQHAQERIARQP